MSKKYGYVRVSSSSQNLDRQIKELESHDLIIFEDKASGKDFNRTQWLQLEKNLKRSDELFITSLDRLARDKELIKSKLADLKARGVVIRILDVPTTMQDFPVGSEWVQDMIYNILIEVLSTMAQKERESIRVRQAQGIANAKANGKYAVKVTQSDFKPFYEKYLSREIKTKSALADVLKISRVTLDKLIKEFETKFVG